MYQLYWIGGISEKLKKNNIYEKNKTIIFNE